MVKNLPTNARDTRSIPDPGGSHMPQSEETYVPQLLRMCAGPGSYNYWSPYTLNPTLHNKRSPCNEKTAHHTWRVAHARCNQRIRNNRDPAQPEINKYYLKITFKLFFEQCSYVFTKAHLLSFCYMSSILLHFCFLSQKIGNFIKILIWILI